MEVWPPQSPDLNPIDHVWDILEAKIECYKPKNLRELEEIIKEEWSKVSAIALENLISSTRLRVDIQNIKTSLNTELLLAYYNNWL